MKGKLIDMTGQRFTRLTVISRAENRYGNVYWNCVCDCGNKRVVAGSKLRSGEIISCGCLIRERFAKHSRRYADVEGINRRDSRLYKIWQGMRSRCTNPNHTGYKYWGGKGVKICDEWSEYPPFREWALANGYDDGLSIDRIDNNGDYCPENCRWTNIIQQSNNRSDNLHITVGDQTHTVAEWSYITGIPRDRLYKRLKYGIAGERFLAKEKLTNDRYSRKAE